MCVRSVVGDIAQLGINSTVLLSKKNMMMVGDTAILVGEKERV